MYIDRDEEKLERIVGYLNKQEREKFLAIVRKYGAGRSAALREIVVKVYDQEFTNNQHSKCVNEY